MIELLFFAVTFKIDAFFPTMYDRIDTPAEETPVKIWCLLKGPKG